MTVQRKSNSIMIKGMAAKEVIGLKLINNVKAMTEKILGIMGRNR